MSENSLSFVCPKCKHRYLSAASDGPRAVCPECSYSPTLIEFMDSQRESPWPFVLGLLALALSVAVVFYFVASE